MRELDEFLNGRFMTIIGHGLYWYSFRSLQFKRFTEEEKFQFLTLSTRAYRESLVST